MKISNQSIAAAKNALENSGIVNPNDKTYEKSFKGYISSFGAAVAQSGLLAAILFYESEDHNAESDRGKVIKAIRQIVFPEHATAQNPHTETCPVSNLTLTEYFLKNPDQLRTKHKNILNAFIALKLALRMYQSKNKEENKDKTNQDGKNENI